MLRAKPIDVKNYVVCARLRRSDVLPFSAFRTSTHDWLLLMRVFYVTVRMSHGGPAGGGLETVWNGAESEEVSLLS